MKNTGLIKLSLFTIGILAVLLFVWACSEGEKVSTTDSVTLEWWHFWTDPDIRPTIEQMVAEYEKSSPNVKIKMTDLTWANGHEKIVVAFSSGTAPDIVELGSDWIPEFSFSGQLAAMTSVVTADSGSYYGWTPTLYNNDIYAHPWIMGTRVLFINRGLLKRTALDSNFIPLNWPDLKKLCFSIDSLGDDIYGFGSNAAEKHRLYKKFLPFFWSMDGAIFGYTNRFAGFGGDQAYKSMKFYRELHDSCSLVDTQRGLEDAFLEGKVGVIISGDWLLKRIKKENRDIDIITTLIPGPKFPGKSFLGGEYLAAGAKSPHKEEAIKFIRFITSPERQLRFCKANYSANPSSKTAASDSFFVGDPHLQTFIKQINLSQMPPADPQWVYIEDLIESTLEKILFEKAPMAETLYETNKKIQEYMDKKK